MTGYNPSQILNRIEQEMSGTDLSHSVTALPGDKWLCSSVMQKAIRRGHTETALRASINLWAQDRRSFWRRLHVLSVEDGGIACADTVVKILTVHEAPAFRKRVGDLRVGLFLVKATCEAVKSRLADQMYTICDRAPEYRSLRLELSNTSDSTLADYVLDVDLPLQRRLLSLWLVSGTKRLPSDHLPERQGSPQKAAELLRSLKAPADLTESCIAVMGRTQWPLALMTPVLWGEAKKQPLSVFHDPLPVLPDVEGIPVYGVDQFTRIGKACLRQFQKAIPDLKPFKSEQLGVTLFYLEGEKTDRTLTSPSLDAYRQAGELADIEATGLYVPEYLGLKSCVAENLHILHDIRCKQLRRYLDGEQE